MKTATLPDLLALNDRLVAMAAAEVPLDRELVRSRTALPVTLTEVNAAVARRIDAGQTLEQSLVAEERLTPAYRLLLQLAVNSDDRSTALVGPQRLARSADNASRILQRALIYPSIICGMVYVGMILFCLYLIPALESLYVNMRLPAGWSLRVLNTLRATLPYWVALPPLVLGLIFVLLQRPPTAGHSQRRPISAWLPGMQRVMWIQNCSAWADTLANLLAAGMPFDKAWQLTAEADHDWIFPREFDASDASFARVPPFLRWALFRSEPLMNRAAALRLAADLYYESAERQISRLRIAVPLLFSVVLGGGVTFLYALALFVPIAHLLQTLAS